MTWRSFKGFLSNEQSKATFEQSVKSAKRTYVFEVDGNYTKKETPLGRGGNLDDEICLLYTSPSPRDQRGSRMPSSA